MRLTVSNTDVYRNTDGVTELHTGNGMAGGGTDGD